MQQHSNTLSDCIDLLGYIANGLDKKICDSDACWYRADGKYNWRHTLLVEKSTLVASRSKRFLWWKQKPTLREMIDYAEDCVPFFSIVSSENVYEDVTDESSEDGDGGGTISSILHLKNVLAEKNIDELLYIKANVILNGLLEIYNQKPQVGYQQ